MKTHSRIVTVKQATPNKYSKKGFSFRIIRCFFIEVRGGEI